MTDGIIVVGLDLSLTGTGLAEYNSYTGTFVCSTFKTKGKRSDDFAARHQRLTAIAEHAVDWALLNDPEHRPDLVVIEGPSIGSRHGSQHDRSGLWWKVAGELADEGVQVLVVPPRTRAKYATGSGAAGKDVVLAHVIHQYADFVKGGRIANDNEADAIALAAMGARFLGHQQEASLPDSNLEAMGKVAL